MPELPEVEVVRKYLEATSLHQYIKKTKILDSRILGEISAKRMVESLSGQQFHLATRHGKRLFLKLKKNLWLTLHLGLTGNLFYLNDQEVLPKHTRLLIHFSTGNKLAFDDSRIFGEAGLTNNPQQFIFEKRIGPDALQIDLASFLGIMTNRKKTIKAALIDQRLIAGIGNLYSDESLFQSGICPRARGLEEEKLKDLFLSVKKVLNTALCFDAKVGLFPESFLLHNRHPGGICPLDGALLSHEIIGGRTSYYCPTHQKCKS